MFGAIKELRKRVSKLEWDMIDLRTQTFNALPLYKKEDYSDYFMASSGQVHYQIYRKDYNSLTYTLVHTFDDKEKRDKVFAILTEEKKNGSTKK